MEVLWKRHVMSGTYKFIAEL